MRKGVKVTTLNLSLDAAKELKKLSADRNKAMTEIVEDWIWQAVKRVPVTRKPVTKRKAKAKV